LTWQFTLTGLLIGALVGLTGMGGGALLTPILVLVFGFKPTYAVGSGVKLLNVPAATYVIAIGLGVMLTAFVVWLATGMRGVQSRSDEAQRTHDARAPAHRGDRDGVRGDAAPEARA
jgi:hypothetical protein